MFPRVPHPSATPVLLRAFDLHVLGLPPAFVLSQDQTLKLYEILSRLVTVIKPAPEYRTSSDNRRSVDESQAHPIIKPSQVEIAMNLEIRDRRYVSHASLKPRKA